MSDPSKLLPAVRTIAAQRPDRYVSAHRHGWTVVSEPATPRVGPGWRWSNSVYLVTERSLPPSRMGLPDGLPIEVVRLSTQRHDGRPIHDWRELQRIKTEIVGAEAEAVELYPADSGKTRR